MQCPTDPSRTGFLCLLQDMTNPDHIVTAGVRGVASGLTFPALASGSYMVTLLPMLEDMTSSLSSQPFPQQMSPAFHSELVAVVPIMVTTQGESCIQYCITVY